MQIKELLWEEADWHIAAARARGRDQSGPYSSAVLGRGDVPVLPCNMI